MNNKVAIGGTLTEAAQFILQSPKRGILLEIVSALLVLCILGRFGLAFAALSIDQPLGLGGSWKATAGHGFELLATYFLGFVAAVFGYWGLTWFARKLWPRPLRAILHVLAALHAHRSGTGLADNDQCLAL
jgi:hypothetical protein